MSENQLPLTLEEAMRKLAELRLDLELAEEACSKAEEAYKESADYQVWKGLDDKRAAIASAIVCIDGLAREAALAEFRRTGDKRPAPGITIKECVRYTWNDVAFAAWLERYRPNYLKIVKKIDTVRARKNAPDMLLDGAPIEAHVTYETAIDRDLSAWLIDTKSASEDEVPF